MKRTTGGKRAHELEQVEVPTADKRYVNRKLYVIEGVKGLFRRIAKAADDPRAVEAYYDGSMVQLVPDRVVAHELAEAGWDQVRGVSSEAMPPIPDDGNDRPTTGDMFANVDTTADVEVDDAAPAGAVSVPVTPEAVAALGLPADLADEIESIHVIPPEPVKGELPLLETVDATAELPADPAPAPEARKPARRRRTG